MLEICSTIPEKSRVGVISLIQSTSLRRIFAAMICIQAGRDCSKDKKHSELTVGRQSAIWPL